MLKVFHKVQKVHYKIFIYRILSSILQNILAIRRNSNYKLCTLNNNKKIYIYYICYVIVGFVYQCFNFNRGSYDQISELLTFPMFHGFKNNITHT